VERANFENARSSAPWQGALRKLAFELAIADSLLLVSTTQIAAAIGTTSRAAR
jgi:hypothetical protein